MAIVKFPGKLRRFSRRIPVVWSIINLRAARLESARATSSAFAESIVGYENDLAHTKSLLKRASPGEKLLLERDLHSTKQLIANLKIARLKVLLGSSRLRKEFNLTKHGIRREIKALEEKVAEECDLISAIEKRAKLKPVE